MDERDVEQAITAFLCERFGVEPPSTGASLIESGILDSMMFVDLIVFIEERFGVVAELDDLEIDHFATVAGMARFVIARRGDDRPATIHRL
jgi:acyl carrier protein